MSTENESDSARQEAYKLLQQDAGLSAAGCQVYENEVRRWMDERRTGTAFEISRTVNGKLMQDGTARPRQLRHLVTGEAVHRLVSIYFDALGYGKELVDTGGGQKAWLYYADELGRQQWKAAQASQASHPPAANQAADDDRYIIRQEIGRCHLRFEDEDQCVPGESVNFETLARLLDERGREIGALELLGIGVDVEREEKAKQARSELGGKPQSAAQEDALDEEEIRAVTGRIKDLHKEIEALRTEPDIDRIEKIDDLTDELLKCTDCLDKGTRDKAEKKRKGPPGEADGAVEPETVREIKARIKALMEQIHEAKKKNDSERIVELTKKLLECHDSWNEARRDSEEMERRRSRPLGSPGSDEEALKSVGMRIERAKKAIADTKKMPRLTEHLNKVVLVYGKSKWVYNGTIHWKVEGFSARPKP